jgi:hypothetical protein
MYSIAPAYEIGSAIWLTTGLAHRVTVARATSLYVVALPVPN